MASSIKELIQVPTELMEFAQQPIFHSTLLSVRDQSGINYICVNRNSDTGGLCILIDSQAPDRAALARRLIELHFKQQLKLMTSEARLQKVRTDLFSVQGEVASGLIVDFVVPIELMGIIIGKKGVRLQKIIDDTKVTNIQIKGTQGRVVITGNSQESVQAARELVDLQQEKYELTESQMEFFRRDIHRTCMNEIRDACDLVSVFLETGYLLLTGTRTAMATAIKLLPTQLDYINKQIALEQQEIDVRKQLIGYKKSFGRDGRDDYRSNSRGDGEDLTSGRRNNYSNNNHYTSEGGRYTSSSDQRQHTSSDRGTPRQQSRGGDRDRSSTTVPTTVPTTGGGGGGFHSRSTGSGTGTGAGAIGTRDVPPPLPHSTTALNSHQPVPTASTATAANSNHGSSNKREQRGTTTTSVPIQPSTVTSKKAAEKDHRPVNTAITSAVNTSTASSATIGAATSSIASTTTAGAVAGAVAGGKSAGKRIENTSAKQAQPQQPKQKQQSSRLRKAEDGNEDDDEEEEGRVGSNVKAESSKGIVPPPQKQQANTTTSSTSGSGAGKSNTQQQQRSKETKAAATVRTSVVLAPADEIAAMAANNQALEKQQQQEGKVSPTITASTPITPIATTSTKKKSKNTNNKVKDETKVEKEVSVEAVTVAATEKLTKVDQSSLFGFTKDIFLSLPVSTPTAPSKVTPFVNTSEKSVSISPPPSLGSVYTTSILALLDDSTHNNDDRLNIASNHSTLDSSQQMSAMMSTDVSTPTSREKSKRTAKK